MGAPPFAALFFMTGTIGKGYTSIIAFCEKKVKFSAGTVAAGEILWYNEQKQIKRRLL